MLEAKLKWPLIPLQRSCASSRSATLARRIIYLRFRIGSENSVGMETNEPNIIDSRIEGLDYLTSVVSHQ